MLARLVVSPSGELGGCAGAQVDVEVGRIEQEVFPFARVELMDPPEELRNDPLQLLLPNALPVVPEVLRIQGLKLHRSDALYVGLLYQPLSCLLLRGEMARLMAAYTISSPQEGPLDLLLPSTT